MKIEKDIIICKHKGTFEAFKKIYEPYNTEYKVAEEFVSICHKGKDLFISLETEIKDFNLVLKERDTLMESCLDLSKSEAEYFTQKEKIVKIFKEKISLMQKDFSSSLEEKQKLSEKLIDHEKKYKTLLDEFISFKKKIRSRISTDSKDEEKFCKNCQKSYHEKNNFNWSCKMHSSTFIEGFYWCCGSKVKDSPGCTVSKHLNNSSEGVDEDQYAVKTIMFCAACKSLGHDILNCSKDPNFRSNFDVAEEMTRIVKLKKNNCRFLNVLENDEDDLDSDFSEIIHLKSDCLAAKL